MQGNRIIKLPHTLLRGVRRIHALTKSYSSVSNSLSIFENEQQNQRERMVSKEGPVREVLVHGYGEQTVTVEFCDGLLTPYDCAKHIQTSLLDEVGVAEGDETILDLNQPLVGVKNLKFIKFTDSRPRLANLAYWRSGSFVLGAILTKVFKDKYKVTLHSWPGADYTTGSFVYDVCIEGLQNWKPTREELRIMSLSSYTQILSQNLQFEPLNVSPNIASAIFKDNKFKLEQLDFIERDAYARTGEGSVRLYKLGEHVDASNGPLIANTSQFGPFAISAVYPLCTEFGDLYRFHAISIPKCQMITSWTWEVIVDASRRWNTMPIPSRERYHGKENKKYVL